MGVLEAVHDWMYDRIVRVAALEVWYQDWNSIEVLPGARTGRRRGQTVRPHSKRRLS